MVLAARMFLEKFHVGFELAFSISRLAFALPCLMAANQGKMRLGLVRPEILGWRSGLGAFVWGQHCHLKDLRPNPSTLTEKVPVGKEDGRVNFSISWLSFHSHSQRAGL